MVQTNVYYEHNIVKSPVVVTETGMYASGSVPADDKTSLDVDIVHEVQLTDREGNLIVLHFNAPNLTAGAFAKVRTFSSSGTNNMPSGLFTSTIKSAGTSTKNLLNL